MRKNKTVVKKKRKPDYLSALAILLGIIVAYLVVYSNIDRIWLSLQIYDLVKILITGFISFVLGMWYFNKYILPKLYVQMGSNLFKQAQEDPNLKSTIQKAKKIIEELEPFIAKLKKIDIEKYQKDLQPLIETLTKVDPKEVDDLLKSLKELTGTVQKAIEKPKKIPEPD